MSEKSTNEITLSLTAFHNNVTRSDMTKIRKYINGMISYLLGDITSRSYKCHETNSSYSFILFNHEELFQLIPILFLTLELELSNHLITYATS